MMDADFKTQLLAGVIEKCPCCHRYAKVYKRRIHHGIARQLIELYRAGGNADFIHFSKFMDNSGNGRDFTIARYWGLIEAGSKGVNEQHKKQSGRWMLTLNGVLYVEGKLSVPEYAHVFDNKVLNLDGECRPIQYAIGKNFDYYELMYGE